MDFSLFVHMERLSTKDTYQELHDQFIELALMAEAGGMKTVWTGEHHAMDFTISPNPFLLLVELAGKTERIRLGTGTIVAPFWDPIRLAGEAAMTDLITGGRLELGIARGAYSFEYDRLGGGMDAWAAGEHLREIVPAIKALWAGDYEMQGKHYAFPKSTAVPKPKQAGGPPVWVAARDPNSFDFAMKNDCHVQVTPLWNGDDEVENLMLKFREAKMENPDKSPRIMLLNHTAVGSNEADIAQDAQDLSRFYCTFGAWFRNERPIINGHIKELSSDEMAAIEMFSPENMRKNNVVGTPDQVTARIKTYQAMGYDEYSYWIDSGASFADKKRSLNLFIEEVMPNFKGAA
ncbi:MAG: LLM class flavin-dependent oxidoreductase [Rhodobacterales bacterium]